MSGSKGRRGPRSYRYGGWLPSDRAEINRDIKEIVMEIYGTCDHKKVAAIESGKKPHPHGKKKLLPSVQNLKDLIENDPEIYMLFNQMFTQVPEENRTIPDYKAFIRIINDIVQKAPPCNGSKSIGCPINTILYWPMSTQAGTTAFINDKVTQAFKILLKEWGVYLTSPDSRYVLNDKDGWLGPEAMSKWPNFLDTFVCDPSLPHWGFKSWNDFFARQLKPNIRPIAPGADVIASPCESTPYLCKRNVQLLDVFWIKDQPYAMNFLLAHDPRVEQFVGGTVYQAFLSSANYHRWHSPVDGKVVRAYKVDGGYYAEAYSVGFDDTGDTKSQAYLTSVAARAYVYIQAKNPKIGLMCFVSIGMGEIASNDLVTYEGQDVKKGDELGAFHYGGSSYCMIFRPGVKVHFDYEPPEPDEDKYPLILVNSQVGYVE